MKKKVVEGLNKNSKKKNNSSTKNKKTNVKEEVKVQSNKKVIKEETIVYAKKQTNIYYKLLMIVSVLLFVSSIIQMFIIGIRLVSLNHYLDSNLNVFIELITKESTVFNKANTFILNNSIVENSEVVIFYFFMQISNLIALFSMGVMFSYLAEFYKHVEYNNPFNKKSILLLDKVITCFVMVGVVKTVFGILTLLLTPFELIDMTAILIWLLIVMVVLMFRNVLIIKEGLK